MLPIMLAAVSVLSATPWSDPLAPNTGAIFTPVATSGATEPIFEADTCEYATAKDSYDVWIGALHGGFPLTLKLRSNDTRLCLRRVLPTRNP